MIIIGDDILCTRSHGTIDKLVVIRVIVYQSKMIIHFLIYGGVQASNCFYHIACYLMVCFLRQNFLILFQYLRVYAKTDFPA